MYECINVVVPVVIIRLRPAEWKTNLKANKRSYICMYVHNVCSKYLYDYIERELFACAQCKLKALAVCYLRRNGRFSAGRLPFENFQIIRHKQDSSKEHRAHSVYRHIYQYQHRRRTYIQMLLFVCGRAVFHGMPKVYRRGHTATFSRNDKVSSCAAARTMTASRAYTTRTLTLSQRGLCLDT